MCGIIGYVGQRSAREIVLSALDRLEMRGYDSSGICLHTGDRLDRTRVVGGPSGLGPLVSASDATTGLGHTRWATHGGASEANCHPFWGCAHGEVAIALNGIVENFAELRDGLAADGHHFSSETDAEVVAHLVEDAYEGDLVAAISATVSRLEGHFAFLAVHRDHPETIVGTRREVPLVAGLADDGAFLASSISAFQSETSRFVVVEHGEIVVLGEGGSLTLLSAHGEAVERAPECADWDDDAGDRGDFESYMLKEMHEQPAALAATLEGRVSRDAVLPELELPALSDPFVSRVVLIGCGTSLHAGMAARLMFERWARVVTTTEVASEWRYRDPIVGPDTLVIALSQSGETADTLAALRLARAHGAPTIAVTNTPGSQMTREADAVLLTRAGHEMGVAATKTFVCQVAILAALALRTGIEHGLLDPEEAAALADELLAAPAAVRRYLAGDHPVREIAERLSDAPFLLYLGRDAGVPACMEGALKLRELAYIPTDAYPAGEMKHGPIALVESGTPVICVATDGPAYEKLLSNLQEV
jgi:glucosamine--fructose-6-phosphate aminotransferase (isomerizing)